MLRDGSSATGGTGQRLPVESAASAAAPPVAAAGLSPAVAAGLSPAAAAAGLSPASPAAADPSPAAAAAVATDLSSVSPAALSSAAVATPMPASSGCSGGGVCVGVVDVAGLSDEGLRGRLGVIGRSESTLAAMKTAVLGEIARRHDTAAAERAARVELAASGRSARSDVRLAVSLEAPDATREALAGGAIPAAHARLIARAAGEGPIDEAYLAAAAQPQGYDEFRRTVRRHQADRNGDDGQSLLERQRQDRSGRVFTSTETGMVVLNAHFDPIAGAHITAIVAAKERELYRDEDPDRRPSHHQHTADAIAKLMLEPDAKERPRRGGHLAADRCRLRRRQPTARQRAPRGRHTHPNQRTRAPRLRRADPARRVQPSNRRHGNGPKPPHRHRRPARCTGLSRPGLCRLRQIADLLPSTPHHPLGTRRTHRPQQPRARVQPLPPPHPRRRLASTPPPHQPPLRTPPTKPNTPITTTSRPAGRPPAGPTRDGPTADQSSDRRQDRWLATGDR